MPIKSTLGERLKYFRKRIGISQLDLEIKADLATGVISRLESNRTNPNKETLIKIAKLINLNADETVFLVNPESLFPNEQEIKATIAKLLPYLETSPNIAYLVDSKRRLLYPSNASYKLLNIDPAKGKELLNKTILQLIFDKNFPVRAMIDPKLWEEAALIRCKSYMLEVGYLIDNHEYDDLFEELNNNPEFKNIWEKASHLDIDLFSDKARTISFEINNQPVKFHISYIPVEFDGRFMIVELNPINGH